MHIVTLLPMLLGCIEDDGKDKVEALVEAVPTPSEEIVATPPPADGRSFVVDPTTSQIQALGAKVTAKHPVVFSDFSGAIDVNKGVVQRLTFAVRTASLEADHPKLTKHMKNEDFLWVDKFPEATFQSTKVAAGSDAPGMTHTLTGTLTIRGQSRQVSFPARLEVANQEVVANTEFVINRQDFGISYPGRADDLVQDNVVLTIALRANPG